MGNAAVVAWITPRCFPRARNCVYTISGNGHLSITSLLGPLGDRYKSFVLTLSQGLKQLATEESEISAPSSLRVDKRFTTIQVTYGRYDTIDGIVKGYGGKRIHGLMHVCRKTSG